MFISSIKTKKRIISLYLINFINEIYNWIFKNNENFIKYIEKISKNIKILVYKIEKEFWIKQLNLTYHNNRLIQSLSSKVKIFILFKEIIKFEIELRFL
jgi:hypothetical protein